jgi:hypothetical protein
MSGSGPGLAYAMDIGRVSTDDTGETIGTASRTSLIKADDSLSISGIQILATRDGITTRLTANWGVGGVVRRERTGLRSPYRVSRGTRSPTDGALAAATRPTAGWPRRKHGRSHE